MPDRDRPLLFEIAWEVCRQIGGIYTVLRSKAPSTVAEWGDRYFLIGPYDAATAATEFEPMTPGPLLKPTLDALAARNVRIHYGRWLVAGNPPVLLIDHKAAFDRLSEFKFRFWEDTQISLPASDGETDEAVAFGMLVSEFFEELLSHEAVTPAKVIAHFHEWLGSAGLPVVRNRKLPLATLFTTHATLLGRYICSTRADFYERLPWLDPDYESGSRKIYHRYCIERAATHTAHVFTTVSDVTATEATHLLKRRPDVVTPNGLQIERFAALHEFQNLHARYKEKLHEFVEGHFFGSYTFDLDTTLYFFTSGRYEYRNKGFDVFIEALWRLNRRLKEAGSDRTVVAFLITRAATHSINVGVLQNHFMLEELREICRDITQRMGHRLFDSVASGMMPHPAQLLQQEDIVRLKHMLLSRRRSTLPPIVTHNMVHDAEDAILNHLRHRQLFNAPEDRVKVVYHPDFITATNPLFGINYDEFVRGCHLGVFPSYYEPWGYTPAECAVLGVPNVCSNLSGFGDFIETHVSDHDSRGLYIIDRRHQDSGAAIEQLTDILAEFCQLNRRQRIELRNRTEQVSELLDWAHMGKYYRQARELALERTYQALIP
ncbi:MAG TPA: glycosyltransferase [Phycisphaerae bacterium]|jgi:glycogen(starch) synthase